MKKLLGGFTVLCLAFAMTVANTGCTKPTKKAGGGDPPTDKNVRITAADTKVTLKAGEEKTVTVKLERGNKADKAVNLTTDVDTAAKKVTATVEKDKLEGDKKEATLTIKTDKETPEGTYKIKVVAKSTDSTESTADVTLVVEKAGAAVVVVPKDKDYAVTIVDVKDVTVKAGEKGEAKAIKITLGADAKDAKIAVAVKDKEGKDVKDLKISVEPATMSKTGEATVTIEPAATLTAGDYTGWVIVTGENLKDTKKEFKIKVSEKGK